MCYWLIAHTIMPKLAAFPNAFIHVLCKEGTMTVSNWLQLASKLDLQGMERQAGILKMVDACNWSLCKLEVEDTGKVIPMVSCSPDVTHPDAASRNREIAKQKRWTSIEGSNDGMEQLTRSVEFLKPKIARHWTL